MRVTLRKITKKVAWATVSGAIKYTLELEKLGDPNPPRSIELSGTDQRKRRYSFLELVLAPGTYRFIVKAIGPGTGNTPGPVMELDSGSVKFESPITFWKSLGAIPTWVLAAVIVISLAASVGLTMISKLKGGSHDTPPAQSKVITSVTDSNKTIEVADLRKQITALENRLAVAATSAPRTIVVTQSIERAVATEPATIVTTLTNVVNGVPGKIECLKPGQVIIGNSGTIINGSVTIYPPPGDATRPKTHTIGTPALPPDVSWPQGSQPTRTIEAQACLLTSGCQSFELDPMQIAQGDDIKVVIPDGWAVSWYTPADRIESALDGIPYRDYPGRTARPLNKVQRHEWRFRLPSGNRTAARLELKFERL